MVLTINEEKEKLLSIPLNKQGKKALTQQEKDEIIRTLDQMDRQKVERILSSSRSFTDWLKDAFKWIIEKIAMLEFRHLYEFIRDIFL